VKFTRGTYPDYPGASGSPCWSLKSRWLYFDADWNTRFPFGTSLCLRIGPEPRDPGKPNLSPGFTLDVNAPLGEPNRLYAWLGGGWQVILGLPEFRDFRVTGREAHCKRCRQPVQQDEDGEWLLQGKAPDTGCEDYQCGAGLSHQPVRVIHGEHFTNWRHPHIAGCIRYRYHQDQDGRWVRDARPARGRWGWLTVDRRGQRG
jgi:hypothetical protein